MPKRLSGRLGGLSEPRRSIRTALAPAFPDATKALDTRRVLLAIPLASPRVPKALLNKDRGVEIPNLSRIDSQETPTRVFGLIPVSWEPTGLLTRIFYELNALEAKYSPLSVFVDTCKPNGAPVPTVHINGGFICDYGPKRHAHLLRLDERVISRPGEPRRNIAIHIGGFTTTQLRVIVADIDEEEKSDNVLRVTLELEGQLPTEQEAPRFAPPKGPKSKTA